VAGSFYAGSTESLKRQIEECFTHRFGPGELPTIDKKGARKIVGLICPHAGYMFSGPVAANAYHHLASDGLAEIFVILGPNHYGVGSGVAIMDAGVWRTPLGDIEIDTETAREIVRRSRVIDTDESAHAYEHSLEVQLPFLQYIYGSSFKFVPICFLMQDLDTCREVGEALAETLEDKNAVIIASTDMTHYEPHKRAAEKDKKAIDAAIKLDDKLFYSNLHSYKISACGYGPVIALITAAKKTGVKKAELLSYKTSGDITGDTSAVVGYASLVFEK
jgi:AmmeMemoRadiSam system protein B